MFGKVVYKSYLGRVVKCVNKEYDEEYITKTITFVVELTVHTKYRKHYVPYCCCKELSQAIDKLIEIGK